MGPKNYNNIIVVLGLILITGCGATPVVEHPEKTVSELELADTAYNNGDFLEAAKLYSSWLRENPQDTAVYLKKAQAYEKVNDPKYYKFALAAYNDAIAQDPSNISLLLHRAHIFYQMKKYSQADTDLQKLIGDQGFEDLEPLSQFQAYVLNAQVKAAIDQNEKSLHKALKSLEMAEHVRLQYPQDINLPYYQILLYNRAMLQYRLHLFEEARESLETYLMHADQDQLELSPQIYRQLVIIYYWCSDFKKARQMMKHLSAEDLQKLGKAFEDQSFFQK